MAVRQVYEHSIYLAGVIEGVDAVAPRGPIDNSDLTRRELEILRLVAEGNVECPARRVCFGSPSRR